MTYLSQRDKFRCGPVAIINALRWAGEDCDYKGNIQRFSQQCQCEAGSGTRHRTFERTLRKVGKRIFEVELVREPSYASMERSLKAGKALIWNFQHERGRHYALIVAATDKTIVIANYKQGVALSHVPQETVKKITEQRDTQQKVWVLTKHD